MLRARPHLLHLRFPLPTLPSNTPPPPPPPQSLQGLEALTLMTLYGHVSGILDIFSGFGTIVNNLLKPSLGYHMVFKVWRRDETKGRLSCIYNMDRKHLRFSELSVTELYIFVSVVFILLLHEINTNKYFK